MKLLNQLERKLGRYAIHNLMRYIVALYALGLVVKPEVYHRFLSLDIDMLLKGQIWRVVTFLIQPVSLTNVLFLAIELYLYFMIGNALEQAWGAFRFNLYFISGIIFNILAVVIVYAITAAMPGVPATSMNIGLTYINRSMFFAFAALYPNMQFLMFFIVPVKVKYLAYFYGAYIAFQVFTYLFSGSLLQSSIGISIIVAMANFLIFFFSTRNYRSVSPREFQRKAKFRKQMREGAGYNNVRPFPGNFVFVPNVKVIMNIAWIICLPMNM
ncbi:MAG: hypothetical protein K0S47_1927 [Herbinix sp.]|nr:hypothetical protein [Herbinix sp.]